MRRVVGSVVLAAGALVMCEPQPQQKVAVLSDNATTPARSDACREDIPDCVAVCALRETHRTEFIDFYERRCAAVILGKNPDKVPQEVLQPTPYPSATASPSATTAEFPPDNRGSLSLQPPPQAPFDPSAVPRTGGNEPPECRAARMLRAQKREREADMLSALCAAKGGDAGP